MSSHGRISETGVASDTLQSWPEAYRANLSKVRYGARSRSCSGFVTQNILQQILGKTHGECRQH
jgi:hypothetical protein